MQSGNAQGQGTMNGARKAQPPAPVSQRVVAWTLRMWRPGATVVAFGLALLLTGHVINGKHGLSVWQQKRGEDKQLRKEIDTLEGDNARLRERNEKLKSDPHAIEREAREKLHYAKPWEVIYALPPDPPAPNQPAAK